MIISIGQRVLFLHESGGGTVLDLPGKNRVLVECEDGFKRVFRIDEVTTMKGEMKDHGEINVKDPEYGGLSTKQQKSGSAMPTIDLHMHNLTDNGRYEEEGKALEKQLTELRNFIEKERAKKTRNLIIIHGVGNGILKQAVRNYLRNFNGIEFFDADYSEFGYGATRVIFRYDY